LAADALTLAGIDAYYGDSHVLHDVSFTLGAGRVLALLGRNGAGKSTCMSAIMGWLAPRRGDVRLFGEPIAGLGPEAIARRGVGFVPQGRRVFPTLTVRENLEVARRRASGCTRAWTLERVLELFPSLAKRRAQAAGSLSGGEQQMLAIGRSLMGNPRVVLMDEPSEGLAPIVVAEVGRTIARLKAEGQAIVLVEQNLRLALDLADDVAILNTGRIVHEGTAAEARARPELLHTHLGIL